jgi:hypothetical protein
VLINEYRLNKGILIEAEMKDSYWKASCFRCWILCVCLYLFPGGNPLTSYASGNKAATLQVTVAVPLRQSMDILSHVSTLVVTDSDIRRGYMDIAEATRIVIHNNDKSGCLLLIQGLQQPFKKVLITGLDRETEINSAEAFIHHAYMKNEMPRVLRCRFYLADDAVPGEYPWPLSFSIHILS